MTGRALAILGRFLALVLACALLAQGAHAQWTPSGAAGQSTLAISDPGKALALASGVRVLVAGQEDKRLSVVDPDAGTVLGQVPLPHEPRSVAISADGARAYVVYGNDQLTAVDVVARAVLATWTVGGELRSVVLMAGEAELAVADAAPNRLLAVDASTGAVTRQLALSHEPREAVSANGGGRLAVGAVNGWLITVDAASFTVLSQLKLADEIRSLAWWEVGARLLAMHKRADAVSLVDLSVPQVTATVALDGDPDRAAVAQGSGVGYVGTHDDATVNRVDLAGPALLGRYAIASRVNALVFDPVANVLYGAPRGDEKLLRLDPSAASLISVLQLQKRLRDVAVNQATHEAVAVADKSDEMFVIKLSDRTVRQIALPARPDLVAVDSTLNHAVVAFRGSGPKLRFADLAANSLFPEAVDYDKNLNAIAVDSTRALALAIAEGNRPVLFVDLNTRTRLADGPVERYRALGIHSDRGVAYLATEDRQLKVLDLASRTITATVELGFKANAIAVDEGLDRAVITTGSENKAHVLNLATLVLEASHTLPNNPGAVSLQPDTHVAVVASRESDALSLVDLVTGVPTPAFTSIDKAHALAVSKRYNEALVLSGERDEVAFVQLPNPVPALQVLSPSQAPAGSATLVLTLTGTGFVDASKAYFGTTALTTRWQSATELQADVPANLLATPGSVQVTVQNPAPAGGTSNALTFSVLGAPTLASIAPPSAVADGEPKPLQLTGENFVDGASVLFGTNTLPAIFNSATSLTVVVPGTLTSTAGTIQVSVVNPGGLVSNAVTFTLAPALAIHSIAPTSGDIGTLVTLTGTGFDPSPAANQLVFRGIDNTTVPAAALTASATQITVRVPPLADTGPITLTNSRGTVQSAPFTVTREQDFQLVINPAAVTVYQGASNIVQAQLSNTGTRSFTGLVSLSVEGLPAGLGASFSPARTLSAFQTGAITLAASGAAAPGSYSATVKATFTEGGVPFVRSSPLNVTVAASTNVTGLKGRFVTPEGHGIAGVIVRADTSQNPPPQTIADAAGNFVLTGLPAGQITLRFDATPANPLYPIWPYTITIEANQIAVLADWTINPPPSDDKFTPIANATQDQVIVDPRFPGLAIKLPAGVTITGWDGVPKTRIAVEKIMPDKLPVTAPPVPIREAYQLYFGTPMGGIPSQPIPVTLPNVSEMEPGDQVEIWYFDGSPMGGSGEWKMAGLGTVSPDGKTVASNPGVGIPRFCGVCGLLSLGCPPPPTPPQPPPNDCPKCGNPVDLFTGQELMGMDLMSLQGLTPIDLSMKYNPVDAYNNRAGTVGSLGFGWVLGYDVGFLPFQGPQKRLVMPGSRFVNFVDDGGGNYRPFDDPTFDGAVIRATNAAANEWELKHKDGRIWRFKPFAGVTGNIRGGPPTFVTEMVDQAGNVLAINRQSNGRILNLSAPGGHGVSMTYGANGFVSQMIDTANRTVKFTYTPSNRIATAADPDDRITTFTYVDDTEIPADAACTAEQPTMGERLKTIKYPGRPGQTENFYGSSRRILRQLGQDGREFKAAYKVTGACLTRTTNPGVKCTVNCPDTDSWENFQAGWRFHGGRVIGVGVTQPDGNVVSYSFTAKGMAPSFTDAQGQSSTNKYDAANRLIQRTDPMGRIWKYSYDAAGNAAQTIDPLGRVVDVSYDAKWNRPISVTRYLDNSPIVTQTQYHSTIGQPTSIKDPLLQTTTFTYTPQGQVKTLTVPGNRTSSFEYNAAGDLIRVTDALGNDSSHASDNAGRSTHTTDALGFTTQATYNGSSQIMTIIDPLGKLTQRNYDAAGRLASVVNPLNKTIEAYEYDAGDRITARTDAKLKSTLYQYDGSGRVSQFRDRKGQVTGFAYDAKNRLNRIEYPDAVQTRSYDAAGRLTEIREAASSISYAYDNTDRVIRVTTETAAGRHEVDYEYDALDRITQRTLNGGDQTIYAYDNANRPRTIAYRGQVTSYTWDDANRLISKTLPNGIVQEFSYDDADRLLSIVYKKADNSVTESIAYTYDANGRRLSKANTSQSLQETGISATYDDANRLTTLTLTATGQSFALNYDDNGNLASKTDQTDPSNVTTYTWDSRNRLIEIHAPGLTASFAYDPLGRRASKTVNGTSVAYVYDGAQAIGEITNGTLSVGLLATLTLDDMVARYSQPGDRTYLTDALGSVIAQARDDQSIQNYYVYSPYGEVTALGSDEANPLQYTGRENDGTALYYYRARYYDPVLKRFTTEDPIGLDGGLNVYAYVAGNPITNGDPTGLHHDSPGGDPYPNCSGQDARCRSGMAPPNTEECCDEEKLAQCYAAVPGGAMACAACRATRLPQPCTMCALNIIRQLACRLAFCRRVPVGTCQPSPSCVVN